jgi:hypothetical protein
MKFLKKINKEYQVGNGVEAKFHVIDRYHCEMAKKYINY